MLCGFITKTLGHKTEEVLDFKSKHHMKKPFQFVLIDADFYFILSSLDKDFSLIYNSLPHFLVRVSSVSKG